MKYSCEIHIAVPRTKVIEYFDSLENMKYWQDGFIHYELLGGEPGKPGTKTRLQYKMGKREIEMIETINVRNFPKEFSANYEAKGVWNNVVNLFFEEEGGTRWLTENEFRFSTLFMKILGFLMPGNFKKQSVKYLHDFKRFAEEKYAQEKLINKQTSGIKPGV